MPARIKRPEALPYVAVVLLTALLVFFFYSLAAWLGVGRGILFPHGAPLAGALPSLAKVGARLEFAGGPCGWLGPSVTREARAEGGVQSAGVQVTDHFEPNVIIARRHIPLRLDLHLSYSSVCSEVFRIPSLRVRKRLAAGKTTSIMIFPSRPGRLTFTCGRNMMKGSILVR